MTVGPFHDCTDYSRLYSHQSLLKVTGWNENCTINFLTRQTSLYCDRMRMIVIRIGCAVRNSLIIQELRAQTITITCHNCITSMSPNIVNNNVT